MALDVMRHRLVLSYEALSDDVSADELLRTDPRPAIPVPGRPAAGPWQRPTSAPERILQRLDWKVIRRLDGLLQGDYRSLFYGFGLDFADLREYQPEDDIRYIDWNVTARMDTPYVRQYLEDREITAWFLLDLSPSVDFGTAEQTAHKRSVLIDFVGTLARLLTRHGNRVGAIFYGDQAGADASPPRGGRLQVLRLINDLLEQPQLARAPLTDLRPLLEAGLRAIKRPLARLRHLGLHQRAGLGAPLEPAEPAPRGAGGPAVRPARDRAARHRAADHGGRRDRRAALRRHARPRLPEAVRRGGRAARAHAPRARSRGRRRLALSTDEDLVRAIVRIAPLRQRRRA